MEYTKASASAEAFVLVFVEEWIMRAAQVRHYIDRAGDFLNGMNLLRDDEAFHNSSALLAIHSAISYTDALRNGLGVRHLSGEDHRTAVEALERLLTGYQGDRRGIRYLHDMLSKKSLVAYGNRRIELKNYQLLVLRAEQYAKWANMVGSQLAIEGWKHDDQ